eukprot:gene11687-34410_t
MHSGRCCCNASFPGDPGGKEGENPFSDEIHKLWECGPVWAYMKPSMAASSSAPGCWHHNETDRSTVIRSTITCDGGTSKKTNIGASWFFVAFIPKARSNAITKTDMDAKPKRKVAVPIPDGYTWPEFIAQVKKKLKIMGVKEMTLATSGQKISSLDELQDIDELSVVEGAELSVSAEAAQRTTGGVSTSEAAGTTDRHKNDDEGKYRAKVNPLRRMLQRLLPGLFAPGLPVTTKMLQRLPPGLFAPGLPVTTKDTGSDQASSYSAEGARMLPRRLRRAKRSGFSLGTAILLIAIFFCFATMLWFGLKTNSAFTGSQGLEPVVNVAGDPLGSALTLDAEADAGGDAYGGGDAGGGGNGGLGEGGGDAPLLSSEDLNPS